MVTAPRLVTVTVVLARPCAFVVLEVGDSCALPLVTVHCTTTPGAGAPALFSTSTTSGCASGWPSVPRWPLPLTTLRPVGGGASSLTMVPVAVAAGPASDPADGV